MSEPTLEQIEDYDTLKGEKRKVVLAVIFAGILMAVIYSFAYNMSEPKDTLDVKESIKTMPVR